MLLLLLLFFLLLLQIILLQAQTRLAEVQLEVLRLQHRIMHPQVCLLYFPDVLKHVLMKYPIFFLSQEYRDLAPLQRLPLQRHH